MSKVEQGIALGDMNSLTLQDPQLFHVGEIHNHLQSWTEMAMRNPSPNHLEVLTRIEHKFSVFPYFQHFEGTFQQTSYDSDQPPSKQFQNNKICAQFQDFIGQTIHERVAIGAFKLVGRVGEVDPPSHIVFPLTVEQGKPHLRYDTRFLNLWMKGKPFKLDSLPDLLPDHSG